MCHENSIKHKMIKDKTRDSKNSTFHHEENNIYSRTRLAKGDKIENE